MRRPMKLATVEEVFMVLALVMPVDYLQYYHRWALDGSPALFS